MSNAVSCSVHSVPVISAAQSSLLRSALLCSVSHGGAAGLREELLFNGIRNQLIAGKEHSCALKRLSLLRN